MYDHVIWPDKYDPKTSAIYALNEIDVKAPPEVVWKLLVQAENWSSYFPPEDRVKILSGQRELALGTKYSRVTVGFPMSLVVTECEPFRRLAWATTVDSDGTGSSAYHGWVITPTEDGCHVLTEETQQGPWFLEELGRKHPGALYRYHQEWVEHLARAAEAEVDNPTDRRPHAGVVMSGGDGPEGPKAFYILIEALPGRGDEVVRMLRDIRASVEVEPATGPWYAVRHSPTRFAIFEAFPDIAGRDAHVSGKGGDIFRDIERMNAILAHPAHVQKVDILFEKRMFA